LFSPLAMQGPRISIFPSPAMRSVPSRRSLRRTGRSEYTRRIRDILRTRPAERCILRGFPHVDQLSGWRADRGRSQQWNAVTSASSLARRRESRRCSVSHLSLRCAEKRDHQESKSCSVVGTNTTIAQKPIPDDWAVPPNHLTIRDSECFMSRATAGTSFASASTPMRNPALVLSLTLEIRHVRHC